VHRAFDEQRQDGGTNIAAPAAATAATAATWAAAAAASAETGTAEAGATEARAAEAGSTKTGSTNATAEAGTEAVERTFVAAGVLADRIAEFVAEGASAMPPLLVQGATVDGSEAEAETAGVGLALEGAVGGCQWGVHGGVSSNSGNAECAPDTLTIYRKLSRCNH
jgi:hypothetical protein